MSFIKLKEILPSAFKDNTNETMVKEVEKVIGFKMPELPPFEWATMAVKELRKAGL